MAEMQAMPRAGPSHKKKFNSNELKKAPPKIDKLKKGSGISQLFSRKNLKKQQEEEAKEAAEAAILAEEEEKKEQERLNVIVKEDADAAAGLGAWFWSCFGVGRDWNGLLSS